MRLGRFQVLAQVGFGGQATVYLARPWVDSAPQRAATRLWLGWLHHQSRIGPVVARRWRLAALKLAHPHATDALLDEYGYLARPGIRHAHLNQLYGRQYGTPGPDLGLDLSQIGIGTTLTAVVRPYMALGYVTGQPLSQLMLMGRIGNRAWVLRVAVQLADVLGYLHQQGLVHHDVRPTNIVVSNWHREPQATLLDLGAAETLAAPRRRAVYGAQGWLAPERCGTQVGPASPLVDIYGLGRVLAALLADRPVSPELQRVVAAATAPDPLKRAAELPDMLSLRDHLLALSGDG
ncbi:MAG: protein kinase domain-containing protein [Oscillochloridaceae bacterium umkhey_bin13]